MNRRKFSKAAASLALAAPALGSISFEETQEPAAPSAPAAPKYGMDKEQEERVKQAVERTERGRGPLRAFSLSYSAEPAFSFTIRPRAKQ